MGRGGGGAAAAVGSGPPSSARFSGPVAGSVGAPRARLYAGEGGRPGRAQLEPWAALRPCDGMRLSAAAKKLIWPAGYQLREPKIRDNFAIFFRLRETVRCERLNKWRWIDLASDDLRSCQFLCRAYPRDCWAVRGISFNLLDYLFRSDGNSRFACSTDLPTLVSEPESTGSTADPVKDSGSWTHSDMYRDCWII